MAKRGSLGSVEARKQAVPELLSEFEFGMIVTWNAFSRWVVRCVSAAGGSELGLMDTVLLHHICHRGRRMKLADICFTLDLADSHVAGYGLRKLASMGLAATEKVGKETLYSPTPEGEALMDRYKQVRAALLADSLDEDEARELARIAVVMRRMSGQYDQAARGATSA
jgi:predicted MarR family transcription regulator